LYGRGDANKTVSRAAELIKGIHNRPNEDIKYVYQFRHRIPKIRGEPVKKTKHHRPFAIQTSTPKPAQQKETGKLNAWPRVKKYLRSDVAVPVFETKFEQNVKNLKTQLGNLSYDMG
jgi:hypothetical protein